MVLKKVDFSKVQDGGVVPEDTYEVLTKKWDIKPNSDGNGEHILAQFAIDGGEHDGATLFQRWFHENEKALWRVKRDLIQLGADPEDLEGEDVDLEAVLNEVFSTTPKRAYATVTVGSYTPKGGGEPRPSNNIEKFELIDA